MSRRLRLAAVVALAGGPLWAALGPRYGGELTVAIDNLPARAGDPAEAYGIAERTVAALVHETLVTIDPSGATAPALARMWTAAADGREWTLTMAPARFHDGSAVTAADAVRSVRRFLRSPSAAAERLAGTLAGGPAFRAGSSEDLPGLLAPDAAHVVLRFEAAVPAPLAPLAAPAAAITSASGSGAGPFVPGARGPRRLDLSAFAEHVRGRPYLDHVALVAMGGSEAAQAELDAGRAQVVLGGESDTKALGVLLLVLDPSRAPLQRAEARQSIVASIDARSLVEHLVPGGDARTGVVPPSLLTPLEPGPLPARIALSGPVELVVSRDVPAPVSQRVLACLSDLGLDASVRPLEPAQALAAPAAARLLWWSPEVAEPGLALREAAALAPGADRAALDAAERERDPDRRRALLHRADAALRSSWTLAPLAAVPLPFHGRASVHGLRGDSNGALRLEDAWREP